MGWDSSDGVIFDLASGGNELASGGNDLLSVGNDLVIGGNELISGEQFRTWWKQVGGGNELVRHVYG